MAFEHVLKATGNDLSPENIRKHDHDSCLAVSLLEHDLEKCEKIMLKQEDRAR
jgi:hypothetical protein